MMQWITAAIASFLMAALVPTVLLTPMQSYENTALVMFVEESEREEEKLIEIETGAGKLQIPLEEYIVGVVLTEMPATFHIEALKAQAVAARTFTKLRMETPKHNECAVCANSSCCQAWCNPNDAETTLGSIKYVEKVRQAVNETEGEYLTYNGDLIESVYFSCSGGRTEAAVAVWGNDIPYLQSVESTGEESSSKFMSEKRISFDEFKKTLLNYDETLCFLVKPEQWIGVVNNTEGGGVDTVGICGKQFSGTELRMLFGLNSTAFEIDVDEENIVFKVRGYGHRVGMSQYGANAMANNGSNYKDILVHYYQDVEIQK